MKRDLQAKFLLHMTAKKQEEEGFTLIELLVVIIIIGILAAIALPSLLGQANKAKQSEAKQNVGTMGRAQQAYFLEWGEFTTNVAELGVGIQTQTENYIYAINSANEMVASNAGSTKATLKNYGAITASIIGDTATNEALTIGTTCESEKPTSPVNTTQANVRALLTPATNLKKGGSIECPKTPKKWKNLGSK